MTEQVSSEAPPTRHKGAFRRVAASVAPTLARALGGPLAGAAVSAVTKAVFGAETADEGALDVAFAGATPDQILALKKADADFQATLAKAAVDAEKIAADDRANARAREIARGDHTPAVMGALIISGFFVVLAVLATHRLPEGMETEFSILLGALATMTAAVVNYYFGSSAGSREKTRLMTDGDTRKAA